VNIGIYFHIPFCLQKCSYCHFLSFPFSVETESRYIKSVLHELKSFSESRNIDEVDSIFFGGGTPSLIPAEHIEQILEECRALFPITENCEISLEANPGSLTSQKVSRYRLAGINRISLGAQSFQDRELAIIGRIHNSAMVYDSVSLLREYEIDNINLDLILGLPEQTPDSWQSNLEQMASLNIPHISIYMLDLDDQSPLMPRIRNGSLVLPDEDRVADLYLEAVHFLNVREYDHYEISNFSYSGYQCQHNIKYWKRKPVLGFGLGSHSFDGYFRFSNCTEIEEYCRLVESDRSPVVWKEAINAQQALQETLFLGLRLSEGIDWRRLKISDSSKNLLHYENTLREFSVLGLVEWNDMQVRLTEKGRLLSNEIFQRFV
jgi:oxygen-independent coproporphyrinogen III oxidase